MNPDIPAPAPAPAPEGPNWLERQEHAAAAALHTVAEKLDPFEKELAADVQAAASLAWKNAAAGLEVLIDRNEQEWVQNVEKDLLTYLLSLPPGAAPVASVMASLAVGTTKTLLDFAKGKLEAQAATPLLPIGPPLTPPAPVPAKP